MKWLVQKFKDEAFRGWLYRVALGGGAVAAAYGLITEEEIFVWGGFLSILFNTMPTANTSVKREV